MIIVTGASRGLGKAICERMITNGREVFGVARNVEQLAHPGAACDVSNYEELKAIARQLRSDGTTVEGLVNAAGIASMNLALTTPASVTRKIIETNLMGTIFACQVFTPLMVRQKAGTVINFSTIAVALGLKGESVYAASKAGVEGFTRAWAREVADFNICANCIAPGPIDTDLIKGVSATQIDAIVAQQVIQRQFGPESVCDMVELLLDGKSRAITGQVLHVGGA